MAKRVSRTRKLLESIFRIRVWLDVDRIVNITKDLFASASILFAPPKAQKTSAKSAANEQSKAFDEAAHKFHINEKQIEAAQQALLNWSYFMVLVALAIVLLVVYYLSAGWWKASLLAAIGCGIALVLAFRYHFLSFQMRQRKLGCTFKEWLNEGLMGRK